MRESWMGRLAVLGLVATAMIVGPAMGQDADDIRRKEISAKGVELFKNTTNHCHAFRDLAAFAAGKASDPLQLVEDLVKVIIGNSITERRTGPYYIGKNQRCLRRHGLQAGAAR